MKCFEKEGLGSRSPSNGSFNGPVVLLVISKMIPELIHFFLFSIHLGIFLLKKELI